jgi:haloalkane dehalogenase
MFYEEQGEGTPIVFLHGNPTSSYLWRRVLAAFPGPGRCLAPDLIGMGASGKPAIGYRFADHARYLDAWFDTLGLTGVVLVGHDWGGALAFDWATRHPRAVRGVAFLETIVRPMTWSDLGAARPLFESFRTPGQGEQMVLEDNIFIEQALPRTMLAPLSAADLNTYRRPYPWPAARGPLLQWPRELPIEGKPADVVQRVEAYGAWLASSANVPKLLFAFEPGPGTMIGPELVDWCSTNIAALEVAPCGVAGHHAPEDQPDAIAAALTAWCDRHRLRAGRAAPQSGR